ncbi:MULTISPECIES: hypothetical protein [Brevundimonas]|uniref:hypothetical protein n=1 Tax=Brevundimonas TaxID=41275 RepID=UPI0013CEBC14|nr:hypothetical protein [Brevundimonas lutea]
MRKLRTIMSGLAVAAALTLTGGATANNQPACAAANCAGYCECVWQCSASGQGGDCLERCQKLQPKGVICNCGVSPY